MKPRAAPMVMLREVLVHIREETLLCQGQKNAGDARSGPGRPLDERYFRYRRSSVRMGYGPSSLAVSVGEG